MGCTNSTEEQCPKMQAAEAARVAAAATCNNIDEYIKQHLPVGSKKEIQFTDGTWVITHLAGNFGRTFVALEWHPFALGDGPTSIYSTFHVAMEGQYRLCVMDNGVRVRLSYSEGNLRIGIDDYGGCIYTNHC